MQTTLPNASPSGGEAAAHPQRVIKIRRDYNAMGGSETIEDYALRFTPRAFRKWSEWRVANTAFGAGRSWCSKRWAPRLLVRYGFANAFWAILATGLIIFLRAGRSASTRAAWRGHGPASPVAPASATWAPAHLADLRSFTFISSRSKPR
jgi:hypothetical protein